MRDVRASGVAAELEASMDWARSRCDVVTIFLLTTCAAAAVTAAGGPPPPRTGWAELSSVAPGTAVVVLTNDGQRRERYIVGTTDDSLLTVDLSSIASRSRREEILALVRKSPPQYVSTTYVEADGRRVPVVQRFDRAAIVMVAKP
jgi:hypothetical protein